MKSLGNDLGSIVYHKYNKSWFTQCTFNLFASTLLVSYAHKKGKSQRSLDLLILKAILIDYINII